MSIEPIGAGGAEAASSDRAFTPSGPGLSRRRWWVLAVILSATFMQLLDISIVSVAINSIQQTLRASYADTQLVLVGYQIGFAATLILAARLGDVYGRRRLFLVGMVAFTVTSIVCGLAPSIEVLLVSRVLQGISSALMFSQVLAVIQVLFPGRERGAALGAYGTTIGLGTVLGPVAGGVLIQADLTAAAWRPIFLVNAPIGVAALVAALVLLPEFTAPHRLRVDVGGAVLSATGLGLLLYALAEGRNRGWPLWLLTLGAVGLVLLAGFVTQQRRLSRAGRDPILDTRLFGDRAFRVGAALNAVFYAGVSGFFLVFSLYLQAGEGFTALETGLAVLAYALGAAITASAADGVAARIGNRVLLLGAGLLVVGMLSMIATTVLVGIQPHVWSWIPAMTLSGLGFGLFVPSVIDLVLADADPARVGAASGSLTTFQQVGGALGVAVLGVVFFGLLGGIAPAAATDASAGLRTAVGADPAVGTFVACFTEQARAVDPTVTPAGCALGADTPPAVRDAYGRAATTATATAFSDSFARALWYQVAVYLLTLLLVLRLPRPSAARLPATRPAPGPSGT